MNTDKEKQHSLLYYYILCAVGIVVVASVAFYGSHPCWGASLIYLAIVGSQIVLIICAHAATTSTQ